MENLLIDISIGLRGPLPDVSKELFRARVVDVYAESRRVSLHQAQVFPEQALAQAAGDSPAGVGLPVHRTVVEELVLE